MASHHRAHGGSQRSGEEKERVWDKVHTTIPRGLERASRPARVVCCDPTPRPPSSYIDLCPCLPPDQAQKGKTRNEPDLLGSVVLDEAAAALVVDVITGEPALCGAKDRREPADHPRTPRHRVKQRCR